jgi:hypothetical protein
MKVPKKKYGRYSILASKLAAGPTVTVRDKIEASKLRGDMRSFYPTLGLGIGTPSHPPHKIESSENPPEPAFVDGIDARGI